MHILYPICTAKGVVNTDSVKGKMGHKQGF